MERPPSFFAVIVELTHSSRPAFGPLHKIEAHLFEDKYFRFHGSAYGAVAFNFLQLSGKACSSILRDYTHWLDGAKLASVEQSPDGFGHDSSRHATILRNALRGGVEFMHKRSLAFVAIVMPAILAACGGSSGNGSPTPKPSAASASVVFAVAGAAGSQSAGRRAAASSCANNAAAHVVQDLSNWNPPSGSNYQWYAIGVSAEEYNSNCNVVSSAPTIIASPFASTGIPASIGASLPSPPPGQVYVSGVGAGSGSLTVTFPDGTSAAIPVDSYEQFGIACNTSKYYIGGLTTAQMRWSNVGGFYSGGASGSASGCGSYSSPDAPAGDAEEDPAFPAQYDVVFPGGYEITQSGALTPDAIAAVTDCTQFSSQGTTLSVSAAPQTPFILLFKTADGKCAKIYVTQFSSQSTSQQFPVLLGLYALSNSGGKFTY